MNQSLLKSLSLASALTLGLGLSAVSQAETVNAVTDPSFVPFEMMDKDSGEMIGFDMDILREVADRAGFDINLRTMDFNGIIPAVQTGNADLAIAGITITDEREKIVDFSDPYYDSGLRILVSAGDDSVKELSDLEGKRIGTKIGSTSYDYLQKHLGDKAEIKPYPGSADMYLALMGGSVDAVFYDAPNVGYFAKTKGEGRAQVVGPLYEGQQYGIAFTSGSKWVEPANKALAAMKKDGTYADIYKKWFGEMPDSQ
ncbi:MULTISPECIES: transporter substrate-binding domain-containing protein [Modicisalibacter]|uniref:Transporter substrate-binding domain-containing protein n=1 Tax=Modicisalibacter tunisiensis TaxID=390637 RepID=A0ABS7WXF8_9GAMM|nr:MULTISPECIES: transporter substrate-binding domain-containing protein [Modicisalibacter]KXS38233.1 MAG: glutamine transport system substrate-binding protein [Halomonadaceae bacterium T82-2]MBZ9539709.1 transporter substrate-binding domain-containing protein [Modicisalibacter tunisiensis]MBZ9566903.1 transporter substrate-binding domain-containing protein [Modicisalibacter tunisiensis]